MRCRERNRKTWRECVKDDMKVLGLQPELAVFKDMWAPYGQTSNSSCLTLARFGRNGHFDILKINDESTRVIKCSISRNQAFIPIILFQLVKDFSRSIDENKITMGVFVYLAKAFDTLN